MPRSSHRQSGDCWAVSLSCGNMLCLLQPSHRTLIWEGPLPSSTPQALENDQLWALLANKIHMTQMVLWLCVSVSDLHTPALFHITEMLLLEFLNKRLQKLRCIFRYPRNSPVGLFHPQSLCTPLVEQRRRIPLLFLFRTPADEQYLSWANSCLQCLEAGAYSKLEWGDI